jgi:hypothetical protein
MHLLFFLVSLLVYQASAVTIIEPNNSTQWTNTGPNFISWTYGTNDPKNLTFQLLHNNNSTFTPIPNLLTADGIIVTGVDLTSSAISFTPSCDAGSPSLPSGTGYTLKALYHAPNGTYTFLNVSQGTFRILTATVESACDPHPVISSPTPISSIKVSSSSTSHHIGAIIGGVIGGIVLCVIAATSAFLFNRYNRKVRSKRTQQFVMRKGLVISASPPPAAAAAAAGDVKIPVV